MLIPGITMADSVVTDPMMPTDELALLISPLTREELLVEAEAIQKVVHAKASEIAEVELEVLRNNKEVEQREEQAESSSGPDSQGPSPAEAQTEVDVSKLETEKESLLEKETRLREERTQLIDNLRATLDELVRKTDNNDAEGQAEILQYRLYARAVSGLHVDVSDTTSAWVNVKGWLISKQGGLRWAINVAKFLGFLVLVWFLSRLLGYSARLVSRRMTISNLQADFLVGTVRWFTLIIGVVWSLTALELSMAPILTMLGAAGLVIALAMQDSLSNVASGLMILFFRPFDMNDIVEAGGVSGRIESLNLVSTTIKTFDNKMMVVPNSKIWSEVITNATDVTQRRVDMEFGISYEADLNLAEGILGDIVANHPKVLQDPAPTIKVMTLGDSSVNFICRPWTSPDDYWDVFWDVTREVKLRFDEAGIGIPFPQRDINVYLKSGRQEKLNAALDEHDTETQEVPDTAHEDGGLDK